MTVKLIAVFGAFALFALFAWACVRAGKENESGDL